MGTEKIGKVIKNSLEEAKKVHPLIWLVGLVIPAGLTAIGVYLTIKGVNKTKEK